jgi:hypothetical protein
MTTKTKPYIYGYDTDSGDSDGWFNIERQAVTKLGLSPVRERVATAFGWGLAERIAQLLNDDPTATEPH